MKFLFLATLLFQSDQDLKRARELLGQAEQIAEAIQEPTFKSLALGKIAEIRAEAHDPEDSLRILGKIPEPYEQSLGYVSVANMLTKNGDAKEARRIVYLGLKVCGEGEKDFRTGNGVAHLVIALAKAGDLDGAVSRLASVPAGPTSQNFAINEVGFVLASYGQHQMALEILARSDDETYVRGIEYIVEEGDPAFALPLIKKIRTVLPRSQAQESIVRAQFRRGHSDVAVAAARDIEHPSTRALILIWLADELRSTKPDLALGLLALARSSTDAIDPPSHQYQAWAGLSRSWSRTGNPANALRFAELAEKAAREISEVWLSLPAGGEICAAYAAGGNLTKALQVATSAPEADREKLLTEIAEAQAEMGDFKGALKTIEPCKKPIHHSRDLFEISRRERKPEEVRKRLTEAALVPTKTPGSIISQASWRPRRRLVTSTVR
jgi:tetratricopeptide (TPR) repeat protein